MILIKSNFKDHIPYISLEFYIKNYEFITELSVKNN